jgi:hypothetical protein
MPHGIIHFLEAFWRQLKEYGAGRSWPSSAGETLLPGLAAGSIVFLEGLRVSFAWWCHQARRGWP